MDHHERERDRGRTSRASSTSSLGREVRCACQFFQSDSLLPERRAMNVTRPSSRNAAQPAMTNLVAGTPEDAAATSHTHREHEYEPIGTPLVNLRTMTPISTAPVVRIIDTDVVPVADSDESIDLRGRFTPGPILEGNELILPLDGQIEDSAMETRESAGGGDTSEELESPLQLQDRIEERFFNAATPCTESRNDCEVNTSQVDSSATEELPLQRGARGLPQRLRCQAGKLRSRIKSIQRPNFSLPIDRLRSEKSKNSSEKSRGTAEKTKSTSDKRSSTSDRVRNSSVENKPPRTTEKRTRMDRIRSSLPDRPRISLPNRPKFNFPDRSKFHLPERPKFNIKKPKIRLPTLGKQCRAPSLGEVQRQRSDESSIGSKRNIFDFSTYPRLFDRKSKNQDEYATSSPIESRAQSTESSTLPKVKKTAPLGRGWSQKFTDIKFADEEEDESVAKTLVERSKPWRRPSIEKPRVALRPQESIDEPESLPWEDSGEKRRNQQNEQLQYEEEEEEDDDDEPEEEIYRVRALKIIQKTSEDSYEEEPPKIDPRLYRDFHLDERDIEVEEIEDTEESMQDREAYRAAFIPVDPRFYRQGKINENETQLGEMEGEEDEPLSSGMDDDISARSDREQQQSSGSSCDRRRRGVIEEIDSDEFFLREKGISQDDMNVGRYLTSEIRDALRTTENALAHEIVIVAAKPPQRPARTRSMRKRKETSVELYDIVAPVRPKRDNQRTSVEADYDYEQESFPDNGRSGMSGSRHRVVYHAESAPLDLGRIEQLDDIVVVKPIRRKSKSSLRSQSLRRSESLIPQTEETTKETTVVPSAPPRRRKRFRDEESTNQTQPPRVNGVDACNGNHSPVSNEPEIEERIKTPAPKKPERAASRETLKLSHASMVLDREYIESPPPVPSKRASRSRGASLVTDDDGTSHGAESIPEIDYTEDDIPQDEDDDSRLDYPGYAMIEKREKPPRPPPPRKRRKEKFWTTPRSGRVPTRPQRAYNTLRPARSRTPSEVTSVTLQDNSNVTTYVELDSEDENERALRSGVVVSKIQGRPLPAPPRPPRSRRDRNNGEPEDTEQIREATPGMSEAFASTQTDPLPDDMVIEEEVTQAKLIVSPSRSGSQILVSTERIPSPTGNFSMCGTRSFSQGPRTLERLPDPKGLEYSKSTELTSEPPERTVSQTFGRVRRTPSPVRRATAPIVPPLPTRKTFYSDDFAEDLDCLDREKSRSKSPSLPRQVIEKPDDYERDVETRLPSSISERMRLDEEFEHARNLRSSILANEPLKITSLEVTDLRVDRLNVATLEAQNITASQIDALVVSATEISNACETSEQNVNLHPTLLRELIAIRSQLELVNASQEAASELPIDRAARERKRDEGKSREIAYSNNQQPTHLQLDQVSRTTETRALFSSTGTSKETSPQRAITFVQAPIDGASKKPELITKDDIIMSEARSSSRSRSSSPGRTGSPTCLRQTASPVKSLPPVISVTPDTPDAIHSRVECSEITMPQRAILSYIQEEELSCESLRERLQLSHRSSSPPISSPTSIVSSNTSRFIAFPASQIPPEFFSLTSPATTPRTVEQEPGIVDLGQQLFRALRVACKRAMRHLVGYIVNRIGHEETDTKMREVELALCALLLIIAGLLIVCFGSPRTITHHHHWDYFNPPRL